MNSNIKNIRMNLLKSRDDFEKVLLDILNPLNKYYSEHKSRICINSTGVVYDEKTVGMECFARTIWGIAPLSVYNKQNKYIDIIIEGIKNGTNPMHKEYWGNPTHYDQKFVEMTPIALALCIVPDQILGNMNDYEKCNLEKWLNSINEKEIVGNNWLFFRMLVNVALKKNNFKYSQKKIDESFRMINEFYIGDGWYTDGIGGKKDYYISFAIHFYSLIYIGLERENDNIRCRELEDRARLFAQDFIYWFSSEGDAIPYGRSLIYRFAQASFWGALAYADIEVYSWGVMKGIILRHLRWWFKQDIFDRDGILNIGYAYPNMLMTENYNGPGSPYWALKAFLPLALPDSHPFWKCEEEELPKLKNKVLQSKPKLISVRQNEGRHVINFFMEKNSSPGLAHSSSKYTKFAYSNVFGFSVQKDSLNLKNDIADSTLSVSLDGDFYKVPNGNKEEYICNKYIYTKWIPWSGIEIKTWLVPGIPWHIRIHRVSTNRDIKLIDSGFCIKKYNFYDENIKREYIENKDSIIIGYEKYKTGIKDISKNGLVSSISPEVNTNILHTRTELPLVSYEAHAGENIFITAVLGDLSNNSIKQINQESPTVKLNNGEIKVNMNGENISFNINENIEFNNNINKSIMYKKNIRLIRSYIKRLIK